jgi:outer membrane biosynthesis protein TonB
MEKFFQKYWYWAQHKIKKIEKHIPHSRDIFRKFLASKNARLVIILIIAAAIPITVLGVQQLQDIRQQAKEKNECGPSSYPLRVSKNPANDGEEIKFSHAEEAITQHMFEEEDFTGNGATGCQLTGSVITCKARYNSKSKKAQSDHTYEFRGNKCNYSVLKKVEPTKKPKDPNKPTATKKPRDPNEPTTAPKCEVNLDSENCTGDNKPRLKASWDVGDNDKGCSIKLNGTEISKECQYGNLNIIELGGKDLESEKKLRDYCFRW